MFEGKQMRKDGIGKIKEKQGKPLQKARKMKQWLLKLGHEMDQHS